MVGLVDMLSNAEVMRRDETEPTMTVLARRDIHDVLGVKDGQSYFCDYVVRFLPRLDVNANESNRAIHGGSRHL